MVWYISVDGIGWYSMVWCSIVWYKYSNLWYRMVRYSIVWYVHSTVLGRDRSSPPRAADGGPAARARAQLQEKSLPRYLLNLVLSSTY